MIPNNDLALVSNAALRSLLHTFCHDLIDRDGMLLLSTRQVREWQVEAGTVDPVDVESSMNKRYVSELVGDFVAGDARDELMVCGRAIIQVWAERIAVRFPERHVIFYLGGSDAVIVRFHVRRDGVHDWLDLDDRQFLLQSRIEVYELRDRCLQQIRQTAGA